MKTPVIRNEPEAVPTIGPGDAAPEMAAPSPSIDGGVGRRGWPARHWRPVTVGALVAALVVGVASVVRMDSVSTPTPGQDGAPDFAAIDPYVQDEMDAQRIPGLALAIVQGDRIVHLRGFGKADDSGRKVTPQTPFFNGSTTKSFTALAIMQLREAGKLDLDAPVQRYLPWWRVADPDASAKITLRQLLYQTSGLAKATGNEHATSSAANASALEDQVRELRSAELTEPVGASWQYSNANYNTLGMVVQAVSGQSYETYVREHILAPLDMRNSVMSVPEAKERGLVTGHSARASGSCPGRSCRSLSHPSPAPSPTASAAARSWSPGSRCRPWGWHGWAPP
jgi:CubicO group peptidase (beta-lactamase class C family)